MAKYVLIVAGQSQAAGRALNTQLNSLYPEIYNHTFTTKVWHDNLAESGGVDTLTRFNVPSPYSGAWEALNPKATSRQFLQQAVGQHGIEPALAYQFEQEHPGDQLYIIKFAYGGIPLAHDTGAAQHDMDWSPLDPATYKRMYWAYTTYVLPQAFASADLVGDDYIPLGFLWEQGESDGISTHPEWYGSNSYLTRLTAFFDGLEVAIPEVSKSIFKRYIGKSLWFFQTNQVPGATQTSDPAQTPIPTDYAGVRAVIADQIAFCANPDNNATLISNTDSLTIKGANYLADPHFDAPAYVQLADQLLTLMIPPAPGVFEMPTTVVAPTASVPALSVNSGAYDLAGNALVFRALNGNILPLYQL